MPPPSIGDDIPLARRTTRPAASSPSRLRSLLWGLFGSVLLILAAVLLLPSPLRRLLGPPPVAGLDARLSSDGRLLGHFPYEEAAPDTLVTVAPGLQLHAAAAEALLAMQAAAGAEGVSLTLLSGFRSVDLQQELFFDVKAERNQTSEERARVSAPPGFSEHSTGYAVDLGDARLPTTDLSPSFDQTPAFRWLQANAARYHFRLSFPPENPQGVNYEPWHWRFEGSADALKLFEPAQRVDRQDLEAVRER